MSHDALRRCAGLAPCKVHGSTRTLPCKVHGSTRTLTGRLPLHGAACKPPAPRREASGSVFHPAAIAAEETPSMSSRPPPASDMVSAIHQQLFDSLRDEAALKEIVLKGRLGPNQPWRQVTVRAVLLKGARRLQFSCLGVRQSVVQNFDEHEAAFELRVLLGLSWMSAQLRSASADLNVQFTKKGKPIVHRAAGAAPSTRAANADAAADARKSAASASRASGMSSVSMASGPLISLEHDRTKRVPIPPNEPHPFLQALGMQTPEGRIKSDMQDKFQQINEFLKLLGHTGELERLAEGRASEPHAASTGPPPARVHGARPLCILDCGCGSSHLTFGTYHYMSSVLGLPTCIMGVDTNAALMQKSNDFCRTLGLLPSDAEFFASPILSFSPPSPPDVVLALHACDTATDDALALGITQEAPIIMAVPCCHKHLHKQMAGKPSPEPFGPLMRHGILRQRQLDMLTDTLRAQLLRVLGYKTDAVEFTSTEHTPRNLLLRAVRIEVGRASRPSMPGSASAARGLKLRGQLLQQYDDLKAFWGGVTPRLEELLAPQLRQLRDELAAAGM